MLGAIVVGYPGVGKTTLCRQNRGSYLDLESSSFSIDSEKFNGWEEVYCRCAIDLAEKGYVVFVSCHKDVRNYLKNFTQDIDILSVFPSISLKDSWVSKLRSRYASDSLDKNLSALRIVEDHYEEDILDLFKEGYFTEVVLNTMNYNLVNLVERTLKDIRL